MNFAFFDIVYSNATFDEIQVIGKEGEKNGRPYHIIGMTRKEKKATVYVLEWLDTSWQEEVFQTKTPRASLKRGIEEQKNSSFFLHIREFLIGEKRYEVAGGSSGPIKSNDYCEAFLLFLRMREAGWSIPTDSVFYETGWDCFSITSIELREELDCLPEWSGEIQVLADSMPESGAIELPVCLECGKTEELAFVLEDGTLANCYINNVYAMDVWAEEEKRFSDPVYRERMLQHVSEAELEQMKEHLFATLAEHCPKGKQYMVLEYECTENISLAFYDKEYLDCIEIPKEGSASAFLMRVKPDKEIGSHGLKLRGCVVQKPLDADTKTIEAELFSYSKMIQKKVDTLS